MFEYDLLHWTTFLTAALLLTLSPGPDLAFILGQTARGGVRSGTLAMFGIWTGALAHVLMAAIGLSAVLASSATVFTVVKWVGAAYLVWLGIQALRSAGDGLIASTQDNGGTDDRASGANIFRQGVLVCALNLKVAVFFLAFLPQFVVPGAGPAWAQLLFHGLLIIAVGAVVEMPIVWAGARIARSLRQNRTVAMVVERTLGALFIGLGVRLALSER